MSVLYKYCNQLGAVKILGSLELKLPYVSEVNDPLECTPRYICEGDNQERQINQHLKEIGIRKNETCLLSVSSTSKESVMWAHYADVHKGMVIGIDFEEILYNTGFPTPKKVNYSKERTVVDISPKADFEELYKTWELVLKTKSKSWEYESECRTLFLVSQLQGLRVNGITRLRELNGSNSWFLCLKPFSIKEIIFGLYAEEGLKLTIRKLVDRPELKHIRFYQAEKSLKTFDFEIIEQFESKN